MAVLNCTPDSFSDGGALYTDLGSDGQSQLNLSLVLSCVETLVNDGATIIDVGGESTRPGARAVGEAEELNRVIPVVEAIVARFEVSVSVDTSTPVVMTESAKAGAALINDVRALRRQGAIAAAASTGLPVCLMHMAGEPKNMQDRPYYCDVVQEVRDFLSIRAQACINSGVKSCNILLDPGFGFGKTLDHNLVLFQNIDQLKALGFPLMVGFSRKSMIGDILQKPVGERMVGSVAMAMLAVQRGVNILRVHDVAATVDALKILKAVEDKYNG